MTPSFVHCHLHSEFSLTDSTIRIGQLVKRCAELGMPAVAVTDNCNFFALVKFFKAAENAGIKPIAGADLFIDGGPSGLFRITALCQNHAGYLSLSRLISRAYLEGHHQETPVIRPEWLFADNDGLIILQGRNSPLAHLMQQAGKPDAISQTAEWLSLFPRRLYLEITRLDLPDESAFNTRAIAFAKQHQVPLLASNDVRFLDAGDFEAHEARVCISAGRVLDDPKRPKAYHPQQYLKSPEQMAELFQDIPEALRNTVELAKRCNLELSLGTYYLPDFPIPQGHTLESWITKQACDGLDARLEKNGMAQAFTGQDYRQRLQIELDVILSMGFAGYFLIVAEFINWAKLEKIPVGPGRGSGAGSLVAWSLGITDLDPMRYDLLFERFLNPERVSMPDFDIDFCMEGRDRVIEHVADLYGREKVSQIITYGTMAAKAVVRDCGRVLGLPYGFVDSIAKLIPMTLGISLDDALGLSEASRKDGNLASQELIQRYHSEDDVRDLIDLARKLEDLTRNAGKHAGGVVIAPRPLTDFTPLYAEQTSPGETATSIVTQFDKDDVEAIGLVKFDFLGLRTLTIIDWAVEAVNEVRAAQKQDAMDILAIPLDDRETYRLLSKGQTTAVFQFESRGMKDYIKKLEPDCFEDLIALAALYRPGPLGAGMVDDFINRRHGRAVVNYPHPKLENILKPTYGVIVYQEQVMQIAQVLAGYSLGGADLLRRAMGKKKPEEMAKERVKFEEGAETNGVNGKVAAGIFDLMEKFADYGFNKSHSAAYALVAYQTAWLKTHYPAQFMAATLSSDMDNTDKVVNFLQDCRQLDIHVLPPDVNASNHHFKALDRHTIQYGLGAVKGVGEGVCQAISEQRGKGGRFTDLLDFCRRVDSSKLNKRVLEALIQSGALDSLGSNRASLTLQLPEVLKATDQMAREALSGQVSLFGESPTSSIRLELASIAEWSFEDKLKAERDTLGFFLSGHPMDPWQAELKQLAAATLADVEKIWNERKDRRGEAPMVVAGLISSMRRRGENQAFVLIEDQGAGLECAFFNEAFVESSGLLTRDRIVLIEGNVREDSFNGGFSMRAKHCWDFQSVLLNHSKSIQCQVDLRVPQAWRELQALIGYYRPGQTPLLLKLLTGQAEGKLRAPASYALRCEPALISRLRQITGISAVSVQLSKPWTVSASAGAVA
ncbi:MAG TPA: DNA polymerase III subunit alpha [Arenimonas sp.]|nr:DNA polymerase III subunit alpha [Arenimonas sp.]